MNRPALIAKCLIASFAFHLLALLYLYWNPLILSSPLKILMGKPVSDPTPLAIEEVEETKKEDVLAEVMQEILVYTQMSDLPEAPESLPLTAEVAPVLEEENSLAASSSLDDQTLEPEEEFSESLNAALAMEETEWEDEAVAMQEEVVLPEASAALDKNVSDVELPTPFVAGPEVEQEDLGLALAKKELALPNLESDESSLQQRLEKTPIATATTLPQLKSDNKALSLDVKKEELFDSNKPTEALEAPSLAAPAMKGDVLQKGSLADLSHYAVSDAPAAQEWNDDFDVDVQMIPKANGKGSIFSLKIAPIGDMTSQSLKQNFYFVIDRTGSIEKHRFNTYKRAVLRAISSLQTGDTFNILLCDKGIAKLSEHNLPFTMQSVLAAEDFLEKQNHKGLFASGDICLNLDKILPAKLHDDEVNTAIFVTDGHTKLSVSRQQGVLKKWLEKNQGKMALYAASCGQSHNLVLLDMLTSLSGGRVILSDTHAAFPRRLAKLVLDLHAPLAKDLMVSVSPTSFENTITLHPRSGHLPNFYLQEPYEIVGSIEKLEPFTLTIQGRHKGQWIVIQKTISFDRAKKGTKSLEKKWIAYQANPYYEKFLSDGKAAYLEQAYELLKPQETGRK